MAHFCVVKARLLIIFFFFLSILNIRAQTQSEFPKIGDHVPSFILDDLHYYSKTKAGSDDFKGKPIILDFFSERCKSCFLSFPHVDSLKKEFDGRVQFVLVGLKSSGIAKQYDNYRKHYGLDLPVDYDDSTLWNQFGVLMVPYTVWIDANGVIKQITHSLALNSDRINNLITGKPQSLTVSTNKGNGGNSDEYANFYDYKKPLLIGGNGGADTSFLYRSLLTKWDYRSYFTMDRFIGPRNKAGIQEIGVGLNILFNLAYGDTVNFLVPRVLDETGSNHYGQWALVPVIESSRVPQFVYDQDSAKNIYSYSLIVRDTNVSIRKLQLMMQNDLKNYFSLEATVETRKMPCWEIVAGKNAEKMIRTRGGEPKLMGSFSDISFQNQPVSILLLEIWSYHPHEPIIIDKTGIDYNIDIKFDAVMSDINEIRKGLQKNGLDLIKGQRDMKVIVVRDSKDF